MRLIERLHEGMWITYEEIMYWAGIYWDEEWSEEEKHNATKEGMKRLYNAASFGKDENREDGLIIFEVYSEEYIPAFDLVCDEFDNMWDKSGLDREDLVAQRFVDKYPDVFIDYSLEEVTDMVYIVLVRRYGVPKATDLFDFYN